MKFVRRHLRGGEFDLERLCGCVILPVVLLGGALLARWPAAWSPACAFHTLSGWPCPTCGTARCLRLLSRGCVGDAWLMQPLAATLLLAGAAFMLYAIVVLTARLPRLRVEWTGRRSGAVRLILAVISLLVLCNWAYLCLNGR
jgi:hypothetical protein